MKRTFRWTVLAILCFASALFAADFVDVEQHGTCNYCGMSREKFAHSRMLIEYDDGSAIGLCSLRCAAVDLSGNLDKIPSAIRVADHDTRQLVDAESALWVLGGDLPGVMTARAKWAFSQQAAAENFVKDHGGELAGFEAAIAAAYADMYQDTQMIREKRKMKRMHKPQ